MSSSRFHIKPSTPWTGHEDLITFEHPFAGRCKHKPSDLGKHCAILGETGCGKSHSYVLPFCRALFSYQLYAEVKTAGLVIDPKSELLEHLLAADELKDRIHCIGSTKNPDAKRQGKALRFFELTPDDEGMRAMLTTLFEMSDQKGGTSGDSLHWRQMGFELVLSMFILQALIMQASFKANGEVLDMFRHVMPGETICQENDQDDEKPKLNSLGVLRELLLRLSCNHEHLTSAHEKLEKLIHIYRIKATSPLSAYVGESDLLKQVSYLRMSVDPDMAILGNPKLLPYVDLDPLPTFPVATDATSRSLTTDYLSFVDTLDEGGIILYQPGTLDSDLDRLVGNCIKKMFVRHIQTRKNMEQPIAYVADEFHRYVSPDAQCGDAIFMSFCRSYRVMTCLCTQSISAIKSSLSEKVNDSGLANTLTESLLSNICTRILMRSTDIATQSNAEKLYPFEVVGSNRPHILAARPLSTLQVGESYYLSATGDYGRERIQLTPPPLQKVKSTLKSKRQNAALA